MQNLLCQPVRSLKELYMRISCTKHAVTACILVLNGPIDREPSIPNVAKKTKGDRYIYLSLANDKSNLVALQTRCLNEKHRLKMELL